MRDHPERISKELEALNPWHLPSPLEELKDKYGEAPFSDLAKSPDRTLKLRPERPLGPTSASLFREAQKTESPPSQGAQKIWGCELEDPLLKGPSPASSSLRVGPIRPPVEVELLEVTFKGKTYYTVPPDTDMRARKNPWVSGPVGSAVLELLGLTKEQVREQGVRVRVI